MARDDTGIKVNGYIVMEEVSATGERVRVLEVENAIHPRNVSTIIGRGLAGLSGAGVGGLVLGNGGASVGGDGSVVYNAARVVENDATLYNQTYKVLLSGGDNGVTGQSGLFCTMAQGAVGATVVVTATAVIPAQYPIGQSDTDGVVGMSNPYAWDEIGLISTDGKLLTHKVFSPILKSKAKELVISYALTITVS